MCGQPAQNRVILRAVYDEKDEIVGMLSVHSCDDCRHKTFLQWLDHLADKQD